MKIPFNNDWIFENEKGIKTNVRLPHNMVDIPYNYFDEKIIQTIGTYYKKFHINDSDKGKDIIIKFDAIGQKADIYLNENLIFTHKGGYDTFSVDLTKFINYGEENELKIIVDSHEDKDIPPFGNVVDYLCYGGIYKEVTLYIINKTHVTDLFIKPRHIDNEWYIDIDLDISRKSDGLISIFDNENNLVYENKYLLNEHNEIKIDINNPQLWSLDEPNLYMIKIDLLDDNKILDEYYTNFGLRTCVFKSDGFYLNDQKIKILGLNRHQSFPYIGYAVSSSLELNDAKILKFELGCNAVRTSHYMNSKHFLSACDKLGLLVFTETPGWQHLGDLNWQDLVLRNMKSMFDMCKNHPSVILYGARINESVDNHDLYTKTNELLHKLDDTRQTGGVRCYKKGEELEDVYTYNDFLEPYLKRGLSKKKNVVKSKDMPYLVSEYNGHMYPTKPFDDAIHQENHLHRLLKGINELYGDKEILGLFIWHFFDYNTHKDFGSGDKICYHGVCDIFRNHKLAASALKLGRKDFFLETSNNRMSGDYAACNIKDMTVLTNADYIELYKNGEFIKKYTHEDTKYPNIKNAPIRVNDLIGDMLETKEGYSKKIANRMKTCLNAYSEYGFKMPLKHLLNMAGLMLFHKIGYQTAYQLYGKYIGNWGQKEVTFEIKAYKDNQNVGNILLSEPKTMHLETKISSQQLVDSDTYDMALIRLRMLDQNNNLCQYYQEALEIENDDKLEIIGPKLNTLKGGMTGLIVKTKGIKGKSIIKIKSQYEEKIIEFEII